MNELEKHEAWAAGLMEGIKAGHGMRKAFEEIATERMVVLLKAGKILEAGYVNQDLTLDVSPAAALDAYEIIADYFEQPDPTADGDSN